MPASFGQADRKEERRLFWVQERQERRRRRRLTVKLRENKGLGCGKKARMVTVLLQKADFNIEFHRLATCSERERL